ncbi:hypothetical protein C0991_004266 [Blastosporella zonata]|nr:hypothetical protein C0991_004266 [Blastosporella zonata]
MPSADHADDEDLACHHADHPPEAPSMHLSESFLWDEVFKDIQMPTSPSNVDAYDFLSRSDGENDFPIDVEPVHYHRDILEEDEDLRHGELAALDSDRDFELEGLVFRPRCNHHVVASDLFEDKAFSLMPPEFDLNDVNDETNLHGSKQYENNDLVDLAFGSDFRLLNSGHIAQDEVWSDQNSQDEVTQMLGKEDGSQARPTEPLASLLLPSISGSLSNREIDPMEQHSIVYWPHHSTEPTNSREDDADIFAPEESIPLEPFADDDNLELGFLSDSTCSNTNRMDLSFDAKHEMFENSGDSVGVVARPGLPGTSFSHQRTTLNITWPSQADCEHQLRHYPDAMEDSDEEFWNTETRGDAGEDTFLTMMELDDSSAALRFTHPSATLAAMLPAQRNKVDMSKLNPQEQQLFAKYGKLPTHKNILMKMQKDRKYFDSGDYALSKAGVAPQNTVGTAIPNPENIPHASPGNGHSNNGHQNLSVSPTSSTSPVNKESGLAHDQNSDVPADEPQDLTATPEPLKD